MEQHICNHLLISLITTSIYHCISTGDYIDFIRVGYYLSNVYRGRGSRYPLRLHHCQEPGDNDSARAI